MTFAIDAAERAVAAIEQARSSESAEKKPVRKTEPAPEVEAPDRDTPAKEFDQATLVESALERNGKEFVFGERSIQFSFNRDVGRVIVKVMSEDTEEVIRQIPPDEYLRFMSQFQELTGVLFDGKA